MLEMLVSSRIRRALLEHIVVHPRDRFYLRGLARELDLSVSPLRRVLKQFERSGLLRSIREANVCFYAVNPASPAFLQLQALQTSDVSLKPRASSFPGPPFTSAGAGQPSAQWKERHKGLPLLWVTSLALAMFVSIVTAGYFTLTHQQQTASGVQTLGRRFIRGPAVVSQSSASGAMRGSRWQVIPGAVGGFTSGAENY